MNTIILDIFDFLDIIDVQFYVYSHITDYSERRYFNQRKQQWIQQHICPLVQKIFPRELINYPFIRSQEHFLDEINYLRNISTYECRSPVVLGEDKFHRPFIVLKYQETVYLPYYHLNHSQIKTLVLFKHINCQWSTTSSLEGSLFSKDPFREYLVFEKDKTSITYKRLQRMYRKEKISIYHNNLEYNYCIPGKI